MTLQDWVHWKKIHRIIYYGILYLLPKFVPTSRTLHTVICYLCPQLVEYAFLAFCVRPLAKNHDK